MNKTKIEWADYTWNPVTGCLHGCEYCYARTMAKRFQGYDNVERDCCDEYEVVRYCRDAGELHDIKLGFEKFQNDKWTLAPYPYGFSPTFHRYRLDEPQAVKKPQNVFVGSMCDLFGAWVPDEWITAVFEACEKAPWHNYMFLTKNPKRYLTTLAAEEPNYWLGATVTNQAEYNIWANLFDDVIHHHHYKNLFLSVEPMQGKIDPNPSIASWIILGAESGNRKNKVEPKKEWIENLIMGRHEYTFMKNSLAPIWGEELIQELPEGLRHD
jgi:protein gp37